MGYGYAVCYYLERAGPDDDRSNPLYPDLKQKVLPSGNMRDLDVNKELQKGVWYVKEEIGKGISIVDKEGIFGYSC
jgi:hypothetical protein